ncbi:MAG: Fatty acid oxidation complex subunit alpha [Pseudomonadales bacterium]|nr:Fatty acid oxidation complex subunit alpha [Pseudomonadales bacterium]
MQYQGKAIKVRALDGGVAELCFDRDGDSVNKFDQLTLGELQQALTLLAGTSGLRGVLITSAKPGYFIVGADIGEFGALFRRGEQALLASLASANAIFNALEDLPAPSVCAINGSALGGGLELCLAADARVLASEARIGLPEVKLGINPGFGGTVRLPRLIGVDNAVEWICGGKEFRADAALRVGVVDAVVTSAGLREAALDLLGQCMGGTLDYAARRREKTQPVLLNDIERMMAFTTGKSVVAAQAGPNMPAPLTAAKSMEKSVGLARAEALAVESKFFARLAMGNESDSLIGLFLNEQAVAKKARRLEESGRKVARAAVLGAGTMGGGVAYQSASCGVPIVMKDIATKGIELGLREAGKLLAGQVDRGRMSATAMAEVLRGITPTLDYDDFDGVDFVVEAVVENEGVKQRVLAECEDRVGPDAILASNTSTISITRLASALKRPQNFCGMHFFNPVHRMPLVEVIRGERSSEAAIATTVAYARQLKKTPIVVRDCPGFLVNRVLFPYFGAFNALLRDGADFREVDRVMQKFGWPMGPAYLLDVVGIDVAHHAAGVMAAGFPERMTIGFRTALEVLFEAGRFGQKSGSGFYRYEQDRRGKQVKQVDPEAQALIAPVCGTAREFSEQEIVERMMVPMCNELVRCLDENIVDSAGEADMALVMGIGFPLFRGGALRYMDHMGLEAFCAAADRHAGIAAVYAVPESLRQRARDGRRFYS